MEKKELETVKESDKKIGQLTTKQRTVLEGIARSKAKNTVEQIDAMVRNIEKNIPKEMSDSYVNLNDIADIDDEDKVRIISPEFYKMIMKLRELKEKITVELKEHNKRIERLKLEKTQFLVNARNDVNSRMNDVVERIWLTPLTSEARELLNEMPTFERILDENKSSSKMITAKK